MRISDASGDRGALLDGADVVSISIIEDMPGMQPYEDVPVTPEIVRHVDALSAHAVGLGRSAMDLGRTTYVLHFKPEIARGIAGGELQMMSAVDGGIRANVVDASHTIRGQASLHKVARAGAAAFAVWQSLALITAQKFLADIDHELVNIESSVRAIQEWLNNDRRAKLRHGWKRIQEIRRALDAGKQPPANIAAFRMQLDGIDYDAGVAMEALAAPGGDLDRRHGGLANQVLADRHLEKNTNAALRFVDDFAAGSTDLLLAIACRAAASQIRYGITGNPGAELPILENLERALWEQVERLRQFYWLARRRVHGLTGTLSLASTDQECRKRLLDHIEARLPAASERTSDLLRRVREALAMLRCDQEEAVGGVVFIVNRAADGSIARVRRPSRAPALAAARSIDAALIDPRHPWIFALIHHLAKTGRT
jgi:hypothetical protein